MSQVVLTVVFWYSAYEMGQPAIEKQGGTLAIFLLGRVSELAPRRRSGSGMVSMHVL